MAQGRAAVLLLLTVLALCRWSDRMCADAVSYPELLVEAEDLQDWLVSTRRDLHKSPELAFHMFNTSVKLRVFLEKHGVSYKFPYAHAGVVAVVGSGNPVVALLIDTDAVSIREPHSEDILYVSQTDGIMHAAGNDAHMAMLMGTVRLLKAHEKDFVGTVQLIFQPGGEGHGGAAKMIQEGVLTGTDAVFGVRVLPTLASGKIATNAGVIMAASVSFTFTVSGDAKHNPVAASAAIITALQAMTSTGPAAAAITVTRLDASSAHHIVPDFATFGGTLRTLSSKAVAATKESMEKTAAKVALAAGCTTQVDWHDSLHPFQPATENNASLTTLTKHVATLMFGADNVQVSEPSLTASDMGAYCQLAACSLTFLGTRNEKIGAVHDLHTPRFKLDESILHKGAALNAALAIEYLRSRMHALPLSVTKTVAPDVETSSLKDAPPESKEEL